MTTIHHLFDIFEISICQNYLSLIKIKIIENVYEICCAHGKWLACKLF